MFDRFTDRARKVMGLARQEAQRFNHDYIGTEHVLLGLVQEGSGVAASVLKNLDIDLKKIRTEVEKLVSTGATMSPTGQLPFTPRAKKVLELSLEEASNLGHTYIGTEHLLLGLIRENEGIAAQVLRNLKVKFQDVREEVLELVGAGPEDMATHDEESAEAQSSSPPNADPSMTERAIEDLEREKERAIAAGDFEKAAQLLDLAQKLRTVRDRVQPRRRMLETLSTVTRVTRRAASELHDAVVELDQIHRHLSAQARAQASPGEAPLVALLDLLRERPDALSRVLGDLKVSEVDFLGALERELRRPTEAGGRGEAGPASEEESGDERR